MSSTTKSSSRAGSPRRQKERRVCHCRRPGCGHRWMQRIPTKHLPERCPLCKSKLWNVPPVAGAEKGPGRPRTKRYKAGTEITVVPEAPEPKEVYRG